MLERIVIGCVIVLGGCAASGPTGAAVTAAGEQPFAKRLAADDAAADQRARADNAGAAEDRDPFGANARIFRERAAFDVAAGDPPLVVDFDDLPAGADVADVVLPGVAVAARSAAAIVVRGDDTWVPRGYRNVDAGASHRLAATSGTQLLSPGGPELAPGPNPALEDDDVILVFDPPVAAAGFDLISGSRDGMSFTDVTVVSVTGATLYSGRIDIAHTRDESLAWPAPGADFWGFVADARTIREIRIDETDDNDVCPDANIGLDSISFAPAPDARGADLDRDGRVGASDLRLVAAEWSAEERNAPRPAGPWRTADVNRDRRVDGEDLLMVLAHYDW